MSSRTSHIFLPNSNAKLYTLSRTISGKGYGTVLLDGGIGGQSSYHGIDDYISTTNRNPTVREGRGLSDKISSRLSKLNICPPSSKPKMKNITLSI